MNGPPNSLQEQTHVTLVERNGDRGWWNRYQLVLHERIGSTSLAVLGADADFIVNRCILAPDQRNSVGWDESNDRSGAVMGAVQSGKTASMFGVIAKALDKGVDAVVVLAGTRTALWLQTWERLREQLDTFPDSRARRLMLPPHDPGDVANGSISVDSLYVLTSQLASRAIGKKPILAVVLKQVDHLQRMADTLHGVVYPQASSLGRPFHLLVVDDEADDSSIGENNLSSAASLQERQVPRRIVDLWESRRHEGTTAVPELRTTYLAYTATPQANFLQDQTNPLAPRNFVVCLRTPGAEGDPEGRTPSYRVPEGLSGWYTGGDVYYKALASVPACVGIDELTEEEQLLQGLRAYLVASAIRLSRADGAVGPRRAAEQTFSASAEASTAGGPVMSMLVHPSAAKDAHFRSAGWLLAWSAGLEPAEGARLLSEGDRHLRTPGLEFDMQVNARAWHQWVADYERSSAQTLKLPGRRPDVTPPTWSEIRRLILEEIVPATTVAVINSDERADDRPVFEPVRDRDEWRTAPNLSTIFVSGNVMSRGLTLEGLSTTVFTRATNDPASDTQMQMQRWFGYRGKYIDVCRVLLSDAQIELFKQYHENDLALRRQILDAMSAEAPASPSVLQGRAFRATGKIKNVAGHSLWPGPSPFISTINSPEQDEHNQQVLLEVFEKGADGVPDDRANQGRLLSETLSLEETSALLDALRYPLQNGGGRDPLAAKRWGAVEHIAGLRPGDPYYPMFRMPENTDPALWGAESPFNIAAYLRFWALCLEERLPAAFSTDEPPLMWSLLDLPTRVAEQPRFRIGMRFGPGSPVSRGPLAELPWPVKPMQRSVDGSRVAGGWGSRNYRGDVMWGDEFFDRYRSGQLPRLTPTRKRERGSDGLLLFHVIEHGGGVAIAPALSIPVGGPDQVHALARESHGTVG